MQGLTHSLDFTKEGLAMNATRICSAAHCDRSLDAKGARGMCAMHYHRALVAGRLESHPRQTAEFDSHEARFFAKVDVSGVCWEWTAATNTRGYGVFGRGGRSAGNAYAHRWAWEFLVGPIPDGLTVDHLCRNTVCVNPDHLELVTLAENVRRANPKRETCERGHSLELAYVRENGNRMCRRCRTVRRAVA